MKKLLLAGVALGLVLACRTSAQAADAPVKIGFIATLSGPNGVLGQELLDGFNLALKEEGGKLGGTAVDVIIGDDQAKPDVGRQLADKMMERDHTELIGGIIFSNVFLALAKPVLDGGVFLVGANAAPSDYAGKLCNQDLFIASWPNDGVHEAMGAWATELKYDNIYLLAPNYPAGKDGLTGFKRFYKGNIVKEVYTQFGQLDYAAELAAVREAKPKAVYFFMPGGMGVNFIKQYAQAGLLKDIPLLGPSFSLDQTILPAVGDAALGAKASTVWSEDLPGDVNKRFVAGFKAAYGRIPSPYAAQSYDMAHLIGSALKATGGKIAADKDGFRTAMHAAKFDSVRGPFKFGANNFPVQNYYGTEIAAGPDGKPYMKLQTTVLKDRADAYVDSCKMKS